MTTSEDRELEEWRSTWRAYGDEEKLHAKLEARVRKDGQSWVRGAAVEVIAAACSTAFVIWLVVRTHGLPVAVAMCGGICVFNGVWLARLFSLREGAFENASRSTDEHVALTKRRIEADRMWARFVLRTTIVLGACSVLFFTWMTIQFWTVYSAEPWRAVVGIGGALLILAAVVAWAKKQEREKERAAKEVDELLGRGLLED